MTTTPEKILSHTVNEKVFKFLGIEEKELLTLTSFDDKNFYTQEGLEDFLKIEVPANSKFLIDNYGVIVLPETGEIIAFQFGRGETAFKVLAPERYKDNYKHIRKGLIGNLKLRGANKVSLGYFSNVYDDADSIVDIRELGNGWALSIYFVGQTEDLIKEFFNQCVNN